MLTHKLLLLQNSIWLHLNQWLVFNKITSNQITFIVIFTVVGVAHLPKIVLICCKKCAHPCFTHLQFLCTSVFTHPFFFVSSIFAHLFFWVAHLWKKHQYCYILCKIREKFSGEASPPGPLIQILHISEKLHICFCSFPEKVHIWWCSSDEQKQMCNSNYCGVRVLFSNKYAEIIR